MTIPFSDFKKLELRVGAIRRAERVPNSEKLIRLEVDFGPTETIDAHKENSPGLSDSDAVRGAGEERSKTYANSMSSSTEARIEGMRQDGKSYRQIIAGIGKTHAPESLIDTQCLFITNLEPRMLMGLESQGMVLAASDMDGNPVLLKPERQIPAGSQIH